MGVAQAQDVEHALDRAVLAAPVQGVEHHVRAGVRAASNALRSRLTSIRVTRKPRSSSAPQRRRR